MIASGPDLCILLTSIRSDTIQAVQPQKIISGLKFQIQEVEGLYYFLSEKKSLIICTVTEQLIFPFYLEYAKCQFSHDAAHFMLLNSKGFYNKNSEFYGTFFSYFSLP